MYIHVLVVLGVDVEHKKNHLKYENASGTPGYHATKHCADLPSRARLFTLPVAVLWRLWQLCQVVPPPAPLSKELV